MPGTASRSGAAYIQPKGPSTSDSTPDAATDFLSPPVRARPVPSAAFATSPAEEDARATSRDSAPRRSNSAIVSGAERGRSAPHTVHRHGVQPLLGPIARGARQVLHVDQRQRHA